MQPHDGSKSNVKETGAAAPNPIHVVGAKALTAARAEALRAFHLGLDEADRNLRALQPRKRVKDPALPLAGLTITDESPAFSNAQAGPVGPVDAVPFPAFELWAPWSLDAADQPA